jgi:hypothetical protein
MSGKLRCYSFHSVKGGVGKSTLSTFVAYGLARQGHDVVLIDLDLTGTSLSDVLALEAPRWAEDTIDLRSSPGAGFFDRATTLERIRERDPQEMMKLRVPFLNDFLLWSDPDWSTEHDVVPGALSWRVQGGPGNLAVIPSSALPADLERIIPVIFDEEHAAFLEARIEVLLDALVPAQGERVVVIDTPPTVPGLSRSVMSLALRLGREPKRALADDEYIPERLGANPVTWQIGMVVSRDRQDLRAAERWLALVEGMDDGLFKLIVNRVPSGEIEQIRAEIFGGSLGPGGGVAPSFPTLSNFGDPLLVPEHSGLQFFQREGTLPTDIAELLAELAGEGA